MNLTTAIDRFLDHRRDRQLSPASIKQYRYQLLDRWYTWRSDHKLADDLHSITADELAQFFHYLAHEHINQKTGALGLEPETINGTWRVLRTFWRSSRRRGWLLPEQHDYFADDELIARPKVPERLRGYIEDSALAGLLDAASANESPEQRARDRAIILLFAETGMRVSELAGLTEERVNQQERSAKIIGKGNRESWVFWGYSSAVALRAYLRVRPGKAGGIIFRSLAPGNVGEPMSADSIRLTIKRIAEAAGVQLPRRAPTHGFRHRFAHKGIEAGLDISMVSQLMRHRDIATTMIYLEQNRKRLQELHSKIRDLD